MKKLIFAATILVAMAPCANALAVTAEQRAEADSHVPIEDGRGIDHALCRMDAYKAQASDIIDYTVACMRVAGYMLEGDATKGETAFKAYCSTRGRYNGRC